MTPRSWIPLACGTATIFAAGFLCAWLVKPAESPPPPEEISAKRDSRSFRSVTLPRRESSARRNADARIAGLLDDGRDWQPGSDEDYPRLIDALQRRGGLTGLDSSGKYLLGRIVGAWYDADPDNALSWVLGLDNSKDQGELLDEIAHHCELGDDFPFREILEALDSKHLPSGLIKEWAKRDIAEAWEWSYPNVSFQLLEGIAETWSLQASSDDVGQFAADLMDESNWDPEIAQGRNLSREQWRVEHVHIVREMLMSRPSPDRFQALLERVPNRQESLNRLVGVGASLNFESADRYREELLRQMTPNERMAAFESFEPHVRRVTDMREYYGEALTLLGHSPEEIDRMVPAADSQ